MDWVKRSLKVIFNHLKSIAEIFRGQNLKDRLLENPEKAKKIEKVSVNWYLVAFMDILGQRNLLRELKGLPTTSGQETIDFIELLKKTAGSVELLRSLFHSFFESYSQSALPIDKLTKEQKEIYKRLKGNPLTSTMFSDFVALFLSLREDENRVPMSSVYSAIFSAASVFLTMLAGRKAIRGGIDIGIALELRSGDIYGSALSRAYEIESNIAQYPRIVIGDELVKYLQVQSERPLETPYDDMNRQLAGICKKLIILDEDGYPFIDFLGEEFKSITANRLEPNAVIQAYQFVVEQWLFFKSCKRSKEAFRYMLLRDYIESRLHIWMDDPGKVKIDAQQASSQGFGPKSSPHP